MCVCVCVCVCARARVLACVCVFGRMCTYETIAVSSQVYIHNEKKMNDLPHVLVHAFRNASEKFSDQVSVSVYPFILIVVLFYFLFLDGTRRSTTAGVY